MFTKWIPLMPNQGTSQGKKMSVLTQEQIKFLLQVIQEHLSQQLGEKIEPQLSQSPSLLQKLGKPPVPSTITDPVSSNRKMDNSLETQLLTTKQKYNELVNRLDVHNEHMKQILSYIVDLFIAIAEILENEDLITPIQDFQNSFQSLNTNKVKKTLKYFERLFEAALDDRIKNKVAGVETEFKEEMNVIRNYSKQIESLYRKQKSKAEELQNKNTKINSNLLQIKQKLKILELTNSETALDSYNRELQKYKQRQNQLSQRIKSLQRDKIKLQKINKQLESDLSKSNHVVEALKSSQSAVIEQLQAESLKKQKNFKNSISKHYHEKTMLSERLQNLESQQILLKQELKTAIETIQQYEKNTTKQPGSSKSLQSSKQQQIDDLKEELSQLREQNKNLVNKDILRELFLKYQDESKEWTIRKDIQNQIYMHLGISIKKSQKIEQKNLGESVKGWLRFF